MTYEVVPQYMVHCILKVEAVIDLNGNIPRKLLHIGVCSLFYISTIGPTVYQKTELLIGVWCTAFYMCRFIYVVKK